MLLLYTETAGNSYTGYAGFFSTKRSFTEKIMKIAEKLRQQHNRLSRIVLLITNSASWIFRFYNELNESEESETTRFS